MNKVRPNPKALFPILVFLVLYLGGGIYFEYISPEEGRMGFYVMSVVVSFGLALIVAFLQNKSLSFDEKVSICAKGIGDDNIVIMLYIFLMAGAFSGLAKEAGGAASTANLMLDILPGSFAIPGMFLIACLISMAMGTSVGTISVIVPIAAEIAKNTNFNMAVITAAVVGGAMFGDNLSMISDTTIAATTSQGCEMRDKFKMNFLIAVPAALVTIVILLIFGRPETVADMGDLSFNFLKVVPYLAVLILALCGINVFIVLSGGIFLSGIIGIATGSINVFEFAQAIWDGFTGMNEVFFLTLFCAGMAEMITYNGGLAWIIEKLRKMMKGKKSAQGGIAALVSLTDLATANNTIAIVITGKVAKDVSAEFGVDPRKSASLLDIFSCVVQGVGFNVHNWVTSNNTAV